MKRPQIPAALSFDGCGINNASAEYCPRILTIPQNLRDDPRTKALGKAAAALPALLEALGDFVRLAQNSPFGSTIEVHESYFEEARAALTLAGYEF